MSPISAACTSAFITYDGNWDRRDGLQRVSNVTGASFTLPFRGSTFTVHGLLGLPTDPETVKNSVDITIDGGTPVRFWDIDGPMVHNSTLDPRIMHTATLQVVEGTFSFERAAWESGDVSTGNRTIRVGTNLVSTTPDGWVPMQQPGNVPQTCTWAANAGITFDFRGNSIVIQGVAPTAPGGVKFTAIVDKQPPGQPMTVFESNGATVDLYRNDSLGEGNHTVTLTTQATDMQGAQFCVNQAIIYNLTALPPPSGSNETSSTGASASPTSTSPLDIIDTKPLSGGQIGGIVVGAFLAPSLILGLLFFLWRRRRNRSPLDPRKQYAIAKHVSYERICSSCSKPITDDYRLECVDLDCPAAVDLHVQCEEWNTPERHSHEVRQVVNK